jgi:hypothetical protein
LVEKKNLQKAKKKPEKKSIGKLIAGAFSFGKKKLKKPPVEIAVT